MRFSLLLLCTFFFNISFAQDPVNPGGIGVENLSAWFKATDLEIEDDVTAWPTSFTNQASVIILTDDEAPYPYATNIGAYSNYNNAVRFTGSTVDSRRVLQRTDPIDLLDNTNSLGTGTFIAVYYLPLDHACTGCHVVNYREGSGGQVDGIQFRAKLGEETGRLAIGTGNSPNASADYIQDFKPNLISYSGNNSAENSMRTYRRALPISEGTPSATTGDTGLYFGVRKVNGDQYNAVFDGLIYEVIFYDRDLTEEELNMVHTYLAVKHGITLDNEGGGEQGDYISPIGQVVWDADDNPAFHNQVIGIASDGTEGLKQNQSHTLNDSTRIYLDELAVGNSENLGSFNNERSYMMVGHNAGHLCGTAESNVEVPDNFDIVERLDREWKVTNTNFSQDVSMDFRVGACIDPTSIDPQQLRFLVSDNDNFINADVYTSGSAVKLNWDEGVVKAEDISTFLLPMNETRYVTIAISSTLSNVETNEDTGFSLFPNPANDYIIIKSKTHKELTIYNALGQKVSNYSLSKISEKETLIDISSLSSGTYFVQIAGMKQSFVK